MPARCTVQSGDTLWSLAVRYYGDGTRWKALAEANGLWEPASLPVGKELILP